MNWELVITALITAVCTAITPILIARYSKNKAERESGLVSDYLNIADMTGAQLERKINQVDRLEKEIEAIKEARRKREEETRAEREELEAKIKAELIDSRDIRIENAEKEKRIARLERAMISQGKYIDTLKTAMQKAEIPVPLNGEVMDSVRRMQLSIEERERLKAGK